VNLNNLSSQGLKEVFQAADDEAGHHVLWIDAKGDVRLDLLTDDLSPVGFQIAQPDVRVRFETFCQGNEYVGQKAASDDNWMNLLLARLQKIELSDSARVQFIETY
jgi:hypothetical protein